MMIIGAHLEKPKNGKSFQEWMNTKTLYQKQIHASFILQLIQIFNVSSLYFLTSSPSPFSQERRGVEDNLLIKSLPPGRGI
jgi:hypothetical protein